MLLRRRILLAGGAVAIASISMQPTAASAAALSCQSFIQWGGENWVLQFDCEDNTGCYYDGNYSYSTFGCTSLQPDGYGCDESQCFGTK